LFCKAQTKKSATKKKVVTKKTCYKKTNIRQVKFAPPVIKDKDQHLPLQEDFNVLQEDKMAVVASFVTLPVTFELQEE
jgi:hypothetical protein